MSPDFDTRRREVPSSPMSPDFDVESSNLVYPILTQGGGDPDFPAFTLISTPGGWTKPPSASVLLYFDAERMDDTLIYPDFNPRRDKPLLGPYVRGEDSNSYICSFLSDLFFVLIPISRKVFYRLRSSENAAYRGGTITKANTTYPRIR
jgi:hypothetical protein